MQNASARRGHTYQNIHISGNARVLLGDSVGGPDGSKITGHADYVGHYSHSSLRPVANYVPRPKLQQQIRESLHEALQRGVQDSRRLVVHGLGGSGKSQLVLHYVQEHRSDYEAVLWIEAGQREAIERDYVQIHQLLFGPRAVGTVPISLQDAVPAVKQWFQRQGGRSLVVFDSADTIDDADSPAYIDLDYFLPDAPSVDIIVTTRSARALDMTTLPAVVVEEMEESEATDLFVKYAKLDLTMAGVAEEVQRIVTELGRLALAITLAGSHVSTTPRLSSDLRQYLLDYQHRRKQLLNIKARKHVHQYSESVLSTWESSFAAVEQQSATASKLLLLLAFINFDDIFLDLFVTDPVESIPESASDSAKAQWQSYISPEASLDRYAVEEAFAVLQTYSLAQWRQDQGAYTIHKLVHAWGSDRLTLEDRQELSVTALRLLADVVPTCSDIAHRRRLVPHLMANFTLLSNVFGTSRHFRQANLNSVAAVANLLHRLGHWSDELPIRVFHLEKTSSTAGPEDPSTLASMNNLAAVLDSQGEYEQAEKIHRQAFRLCETVIGKEHPSTLISMNNLAEVLRSQGQYEQAEEMHRQALRLCKTVLGKEHPSTLISMNNLATALYCQGQYEQAEEMHRQALTLRETMLGKEHPDTLISMNNLALALRNQGKYVQAEEMHRQELRLCRTVLGAEHPDTLTSMSNLAEVLRSQGKYEQAEETCRQTLRLRETVLGKEHPSTLTSMNHRALIYWNQNRFSEAENLQVRVVEISQRVLGPQHPRTMASVQTLAAMCQSQGREKDAVTEAKLLQTLGVESP